MASLATNAHGFPAFTASATIKRERSGRRLHGETASIPLPPPWPKGSVSYALSEE